MLDEEKKNSIKGDTQQSRSRKAPAGISDHMSSAIAVESKPRSTVSGIGTGIQQPTKTRKPTAVEQTNLNSTKGGIGAGLYAKPTGPQKPSGTPYNEVFYSDAHNARLKASADSKITPTGSSTTNTASNNKKTSTNTRTNASTEQAEATKTNSTPTTTNNQAGEIAGPPANSFGIQGITEGLTPDGRRSFTGGGGVPDGQVNTVNLGAPGAQGLGGSRAGNPEFERALASGNYEAALQAANRSDASQMSRLGQLGGQINRQREADLRASQAAKATTPQTDPMLERRAKNLAMRGFSKGAQRVMGMAQQPGRNPNAAGIAGMLPNEVAGYDEARTNQANADVAQAQAAQARTTQQQQGILQGLIDQINNPEVNDDQRQSLIQRYQALSGDEGGSYESRVVDQYDDMGNPIGQTLYTINQRNGQAQAVQPQSMTPGNFPPENHIAALLADPSQAENFDAMYGEGAAARHLGGR